MKYKIFVINLDDRPDKFKSAEDQILAQGLTCERISAVRGSDLTQAEVDQAYSPSLNQANYLKTMSLGEIGCYLSHRLAWQKILDEGLDCAIILEDDCRLEENFKLLGEVLPKLVKWDYIKLTGPRGAKKIVESQSIDQLFSLSHYNKVPISTPGQVVSKQGAKKLLQHSAPFYRPVDVDIQNYWEKEVDIIGLEPKTVDTMGYDSDITAMAQKSGRGQKTKFWKRIKYRAKAAVLNSLSNKKRPKLINYIAK